MEKTILINNVRITQNMKINIGNIKSKFLWFIIFFVYVNPAYLDRFRVFGYFTMVVKLLLFAYFFLFRVMHIKKLSLKILPWIGYALIPTVVTVFSDGDIINAFIYSFTIISVALMFFYEKNKHVKDMVNGLATVMELLVIINLLTIVLVPDGLYTYETNVGWRSNDVWFFGLRNSHSTFLYLACFASTLDYFINERESKKVICVLTHIVAVITVLLLDSGGGIVSFSAYFIMLFLLIRKRKTNLKSFVLKINIVIIVNIAIFIFLSFFAADTNVANIFEIIGEQRVYTMGRRLSIWSAVWEHIMDSPIFGTGFVKAENLTWLTRLAAGATTSHNSMIDICFRGGYVTFIIYCIMLITSGSYIDKNEDINYKFKNYIAISWFTILLLLQSEGAMMSIPLLVTVGITYRLGQNHGISNE